MTRRIWLCADDYGIAPGVSDAIRDLIGKRRLNATSVMVLAPSFDERAAETLVDVARAAGAAIGLHFTLTAPFQPLTPSFRPQRDGSFLTMPNVLGRATLRLLDQRALAEEASAQFEAFAKAFGRPPDFVDGHQHVHLFPQVRDAVMAATQTHAPKAWVRQCGRAAGATLAADPKARLLDALSGRFRRLAAARGIATNPAFSGTYVYDDKADFGGLFPRFLDGLPDGSVVMCHPGTVDPELQRLDPLTHVREREYTYLASERFLAALARGGVELR